MNANTTADRARALLARAGRYPTPAGLQVMRDPEEQRAARRLLAETAPRLAPGDLLALAVLATCLSSRADEGDLT